MTDKTCINITEITILTGKTKGFDLNVDGVKITIPIDEGLFANYRNQFWREKPTPDQRKRFGTLMSLLREAYRNGVSDGEKKAKSIS